MGASENRYGRIGRCLCVHLKGHKSRHFVFDKQNYMYCSSTPLSEEEFKECCEERGWTCIFRKGSAYIQTKDAHFFVTEDGIIFRDGSPYVMNTYINEQEGRRTVPAYHAREIMSLEYVQNELLKMNLSFHNMSQKITEMMSVCNQYKTQPKIIRCKRCRHYDVEAGICKHPTGLKQPFGNAWCCFADDDAIV